MIIINNNNNNINKLSFWSLVYLINYFFFLQLILEILSHINIDWKNPGSMMINDHKWWWWWWKLYLIEMIAKKNLKGLVLYVCELPKAEASPKKMILKCLTLSFFPFLLALFCCYIWFLSIQFRNIVFLFISALSVYFSLYLLCEF